MGQSHPRVTRDELDEGSAVAGRWERRVAMPRGVAGEQLLHRPKRTGSFLCRDMQYWEQTPIRVQQLHEARGTLEEYEALRREVVAKGRDTSGRRWRGWLGKRLELVVEDLQPRFNEKGVAVSVSKVHWGKRSDDWHACRYWFEYAKAPSLGLPDHALGAWRLQDETDGVSDCTVVLASTHSVARARVDATYFTKNFCSPKKTLSLAFSSPVLDTSASGDDVVFQLRHQGDNVHATLTNDTLRLTGVLGGPVVLVKQRNDLVPDAVVVEASNNTIEVAGLPVVVAQAATTLLDAPHPPPASSHIATPSSFSSQKV